MLSAYLIQVAQEDKLLKIIICTQCVGIFEWAIRQQVASLRMNKSVDGLFNGSEMNEGTLVYFLVHTETETK